MPFIDHTLSQFNSVYTFTCYISRIRFNSILSYMARSSYWSEIFTYVFSLRRYRRISSALISKMLKYSKQFKN